MLVLQILKINFCNEFIPENSHVFSVEKFQKNINIYCGNYFT